MIMIGGGASASSSRPLLGAPLGARFVGASAASLAKPGRIKEYALFKDHHFDELGIPRPGSERRRAAPRTGGRCTAGRADTGPGGTAAAG